jgi:CDP-diacylglycerol--glycerol-3-phosphate 3-phosphatidyltransferase
MNLPNSITLARLILIPVMCALYLLKPMLPYAQLYATGVFVVAAFTDFLDGFLARRLNLTTDLGAFFDSIADKVLMFSAFFLLCYDAPYAEYALYVLIGSLIMSARDLIISAFRQIAAAKNLVMKADKLGKLKMILQCFSVPVLMASAEFSALLKFDIIYIFLPGLGLFGLATVLSLVSGTNYIVGNRGVLAKAV